MKLLLPFILICFGIIVSCTTPTSKSPEKTISVSILPQKYFVTAIARNKVNVNVMIPPGASHSSYEPTAKQMNSLTHSDAYFQIGYLDFENAWLPRFVGINSSMKLFDLSKGIDLLEGSCELDHSDGKHAEQEHAMEQGIDPHIWMSAKNAKIIGRNILDALISLYPEDSAAFKSNYKNFIEETVRIDSLYTQNAAVLNGLSFIIYHPALAYLAKDYGMEQIVLEFDGKEPHPAHIKEIIDLAREKNIHTIFVQQQISTDNSRSLASEINAEIIRIDPLDLKWNEQMILILNQLINQQSKVNKNN